MRFLPERKPARHDVAVFTRQLATLVRSGIPLPVSFDILSEQYRSTPLHAPIKGIAHAIHTGHNLSSAFDQHRDVFGSVFVSMLAMGERRGSIDGTLTDLAAYAERDAKTRERLRGALSYPLFVMGVNVFITFCIFRFVLPQLMPLFSSMKGGLPLPTQLLVLIITALQSWIFWLVVGLAATGAWLWLRKWLRSEKGRLERDQLVLRVPVVGRLMQRVMVARISRTVSLLLGSGVILTEALVVAARTCDNVVYRNDLLRAKEELGDRDSLYLCMVEHPLLYPPMFLQMASTGESTGKLDVLLMRAADAYDQQVQEAIDTLITLLEPMLMAFLAVVVGFIIAAIFLPLYGFLSSL